MISACAFSRDSARPRSTSSRSQARCLAALMTCDARSGRPARADAPARSPNGASTSWARGAFLLRHAARGLQAVDRRERDLVLRRVLARGLAERFGGFLHVQNVVHDLKRQADVLAVAGERGVLLVAGARRRWRPCAGWRAAGRRSWRGGWFRAARRVGGLPSPSRSATCPPIMPPTVPEAVASSAISRVLRSSGRCAARPAPERPA